MAVLLRVLLFFILAAVAVRAFGRFLGGLSQGASAPPRPRQGETPVKMARDPECGTFVVPGKALRATSGDTTVWFCSEQCRDAYTRRSRS